MSNGILVINMPERCTDCRLYDCDMDECVLCCKAVPYTRPDWCPISPIPAKKIANDLDSCIVLGDIANRSFAMGWNACIDEIERN